MQFSRFLLWATIPILCFSIGGKLSAQTIDAAVEVATGLRALSADFKVEIVEGLSAIMADQKWEVVGECSNRPTISIEFPTGLSALNADIKVEIVSGLSAIMADRRICITNAQDLDEKLLRALSLIK